MILSYFLLLNLPVLQFSLSINFRPLCKQGTLRLKLPLSESGILLVHDLLHSHVSFIGALGSSLNFAPDLLTYLSISVDVGPSVHHQHVHITIKIIYIYSRTLIPLTNFGVFILRAYYEGAFPLMGLCLATRRAVAASSPCGIALVANSKVSTAPTTSASAISCFLELPPVTSLIFIVTLCNFAASLRYVGSTQDISLIITHVIGTLSK
jgi:hypothetical protein